MAHGTVCSQSVGAAAEEDKPDRLLIAAGVGRWTFHEMPSSIPLATPPPHARGSSQRNRGPATKYLPTRVLQVPFFEHPIQRPHNAAGTEHCHGISHCFHGAQRRHERSSGHGHCIRGKRPPHGRNSGLCTCCRTAYVRLQRVNRVCQLLRCLFIFIVIFRVALHYIGCILIPVQHFDVQCSCCFRRRGCSESQAIPRIVQERLSEMFL